MWLPRLFLVIGVASTWYSHVDSTAGTYFAVERDIPKVAWSPWVSRRSSPWAPPLPKSAFAGSFTSILLSKAYFRMIIASAKCCAVWAYRSCAEPRADEDLVHLESTINGFLEVGGIALRSLYLHMILSDPYAVNSPLPSLNANCKWLAHPSIRAEPPHLAVALFWL
jgi:hypothetical protein